MPVYTYHCDTCKTDVDVYQDCFHSVEAPCPYCGSELRRIFHSTPFIFKSGGTGARKDG